MPGAAAVTPAAGRVTIVDAERFPALRRSVEGGGFGSDNPFPNFDFGLDLILDGIDRLIERQASA